MGVPKSHIEETTKRRLHAIEIYSARLCAMRMDCKWQWHDQKAKVKSRIANISLKKLDYNCNNNKYNNYKHNNNWNNNSNYNNFYS